MKFKCGNSIYKIGPSGKIFITKPYHIPNDPIFCNINGFLNFADCYYGVVETSDFNCEIEGDTLVKLEYQPGYKGSYGEAFIPQRYEGPYPPHKPYMEGPVAGSPKVSYTYTAYTIDPNNDDVYYMFDWDDGTTSDWLGPYQSGEVVSESHTWSKKGTYNLRVKAKDINDQESDWSDPLPVNIPRYNANNYHLKIFERFYRFTNLFQVIKLMFK